MTYHVDLPHDDNSSLQKVKITIECTPQCADWILALSIPLALNGNFAQSALALPEALIMLGEFLGQTDLPAAHWSQTSRDMVEKFIRDMNDYNHAIHFNYHEWFEIFTSELDWIQAKIGSEEDQNLFGIVRFVAEHIAEGKASRAERSLYCKATGTPLDFGDWVERVLENDLSPWTIERAHPGVIDVHRLKEILKNWKEDKPGFSDNDEVPF